MQKEIQGLVLYSGEQGQPVVTLMVDIEGGISDKIRLQHPE